MSEQPILRLAVAAPLPGLFDYLPPPGVDPGGLQKGLRLRVPFGRGSRIGFIWEITDASALPIASLKPAVEVLDKQPLIAPQDLALLHWAADYYRYPLGEVLLSALPVRLRKEPGERKPRNEAWRLTDEGRHVQSDSLSRAPRQAAVINLLQSHPQGMARERLVAECGDCMPVLSRLRDKGWVEAMAAAPNPTSALSPGPTLNAEQTEAVSAVTANPGGFRAYLLDGVTGSGKTEVYLSLIEHFLERGGQVLILVPEIGLTPQLQRRLLRRLKAPVALLHSSMAEGERERGWWNARDGHAGVVLGTRSAVFTPMPRLALILVDEEHDLSFKQQDGFRYSARDLAVRRAQQRACPVLLGSATPSLESLRNATLGRYQHLRLTTRAGGARPPATELIDVRSVRLQDGLSPALIGQLRNNLDAGQQSLLFINRRGYAPILTCHDCGWVAGCPSCDARLTIHQRSELLWCHHCGYQHRMVDRCPKCGRNDLKALGQGTQRLEETLSRLFGDNTVARVDRDSTRRRGSLEKLLADARNGQYPILLGTQMLAKGHHFPDVTLVGILDVDQGLYGADFRASERMAQLIVQVAGRAGRAEKPGRVVIQTRHPDHPLLETLIHKDYGAFAAMALQERRDARLPPFAAQALLRAESHKPEDAGAFLDAAVQIAGVLPQGVEFWGPVPAPMERRAGRYRAHLLIQAVDRTALHDFVADWSPPMQRLKQSRKVRWSLDVDPQEML